MSVTLACSRMNASLQPSGDRLTLETLPSLSVRRSGIAAIQPIT
jgi:hypothetical protein